MSKFELSQPVREFRNQIGNAFPEIRLSVVAGVSGGPDSMCLLYLLHRHEIETTVVHCNYQLRGEASDRDQQLVEEICALWGVECISVRLDPAEGSSRNFQAWARERRYEIFRDLKAETGADAITTAHHQDDQLETILQKILRGGGLSSWKGMSVRDGDLTRPLINVSKTDIMRFVEDFNIPYRIDSSNEDAGYARNFLRHRWLPEMNRFFPGWRENLLSIPERAGEYDQLTDYLLSSVSDGPFRLNRKRFLDLPDAAAIPVFLRFLKNSEWEDIPGKAALGKIAELGTLQTGQSLQLADQLFIIRDRGSFVVTESLEEPGRIEQFAEERLRDGVGIEAGGRPLELLIEPFDGVIRSGFLQLDAVKLQYPVTVRNWAAGDRFQPLGMEGSQLVSDHLTNRKTDSAKKKLAKVIESFDGTICAVIFPHEQPGGDIGTLSDAVRCTSVTKRILTIRNLS